MIGMRVREGDQDLTLAAGRPDEQREAGQAGRGQGEPARRDLQAEPGLGAALGLGRAQRRHPGPPRQLCHPKLRHGTERKP